MHVHFAYTEVDLTGGDFDATKSMEKWSYEQPTPEVAPTRTCKHLSRDLYS